MKQIAMWIFAAIAVLVGFMKTAVPETSNPSPLSVARSGYLFVGGQYTNATGRRVMSGQMYAEFQIPSRRTHFYPIVMIHGGGQSGTNFTQTPDGREGWAWFFLQKGYAVYVVDQVGRGRSAYQPDVYGATTRLDIEDVQRRFTSPERYNLWPQAHLHTQWPGEGKQGDPIFDQFYASQMPGIADIASVQALNRDAILALLAKIGPAILLTHSQSGPFGWLVADTHPELVKAIVAVEPNGPPFFDLRTVGSPEWFQYGVKARPWGITAVRLGYSPSVADPSELSIVEQERPDGPDFARCWLQKSPARQLPNLRKLPILVLTAEASFRSVDDHCTVKYLEQAGVHPTWTKLADIGIHGNGHMMMLEKNNMDIAAVIFRWLEKTILNDSRA